MKAAIFYFSGTGNTAHVSKLIGKYLNSIYTVDLIRIEDAINNGSDPDTDGYDLIGIGFPSIGFNPPKIAVELCKKLKNDPSKKLFLFMTCGGPCYLNNAAFFGIKRILKRRGYALVYESVFCMPPNILIRFDDAIVKRLFIAAEKNAELMAARITEGTVKVRHDRFLPYLYRWLLFILEPPMLKTVPLDFKVTKACSKCQKCVKVCPRCNIRLKKDKIKHGFNCEACYRCVYSCPQRAIKGRLYNAAIFKDGYNIQKKYERCKDADISAPLKGIYKTLASYFNANR